MGIGSGTGENMLIDIHKSFARAHLKMSLTKGTSHSQLQICFISLLVHKN